MTRGSCLAVSGSRLIIIHRASRIVILSIGPTSLLPNTNLPPIQLSSRNGSVASAAITILARNRLVSKFCPASRPIAEIVAKLITDTLASSKIPCLSFINSTSLPNFSATLFCNSALPSARFIPSGVRTWVGVGSSAFSSRPSGSYKRSSGSRLAVSQGKPVLSLRRRNAKRRSPCKPCQPRKAESVAIPAIDLTGYRTSS